MPAVGRRNRHLPSSAWRGRSIAGSATVRATTTDRAWSCQNGPMIVETAAMGSRAVGESLSISDIDGDQTMRAVLRILVEHQLAAYETHRSRSAVLQILTPADLAEGVSKGRYGREPRAVPEPPAFEEAYARAVEGFTDELFFTFLDEVRITDLDLTITIGPHSRLRLVRLVALTG